MRKASVVGLLALLASACGGSERVIVVREVPAEPTSTAAVPTSPPATTAAQVAGEDPAEWGIRGENEPTYEQVIAKVEGMTRDRAAQEGVRRRGLSLVNVMWEDTGRAKGSSLGPNISDLTLQVRHKDASGRFRQALMPVIRFPNFTDRTGDIPADKFFVRVGNEKADGSPLRSVPLTEVLRDLRAFASVPSSIKGNANLLAPRDTHFLVSAQAVFLPIPKSGKAEFNPALFNYQSSPGSPAVLSILVTREGTSMTVIENRPEESVGGRGQEIYFNNKAQRAAFTAERRSDVVARIEAKGGPTTEEEKTALQKGADVLFLVQVPLIHANHGVLGGAGGDGSGVGVGKGAAAVLPKKPMSAPAAGAAPKDKSDVETAVLGHGPNLGPFEEGRGLRLRRDPKFPIRITVQFYKATSNGVVDEKDLDAIAKSIGSVYERASFVGSLVVPEGDPRRPTEWQTIPNEWFPW